MYYKLDEYDIRILKEASAKTHTQFEIVNDLISVEELFCIIEDLNGEIDHWKEKYEELETDLEENYRPIPYHEQVGVYDSDFY